MGRKIVRPAGFSLLLAALAAPAAGQGFSVYEHSACAAARGGAVVAAPCPDASSIYFSPGALAFEPSTIGVGVTAVNNSGTFVYDNSGIVVDREAATPLVPHAYASFRFGADQRFAAALGLFAPYGLTLEWPESFEGRFSSWKTSVSGVYLQPTLAWQIVPGKLGIAAGPQIVFGGLEINEHLDAPVLNPTLYALGVPLGTDLASAKLSGNGTGLGFQVGAFFNASDRLSFGARYMHDVSVDMEGDAEFQRINHPDLTVTVPGLGAVPFDALIDMNGNPFLPGAPLSGGTVKATITYPAQAVVGLNFKVTPAFSVGADYEWTHWSVFDTVTASIENQTEPMKLAMDYNDASTYRAGFTYTVSPALDIRGGFSYNGPAAPDQTVTPLLPDAARQVYGLGFGYSFGSLRAEAYYSYVNQEDRAGRVRSELPGVTNPLDLNVGVYTNKANLFGLTLAYVFGQ